MPASQEYRDGASWAAMEMAYRINRASAIIGSLTEMEIVRAGEILASEMGGGVKERNDL